MKNMREEEMRIFKVCGPGEASVIPALRSVALRGANCQYLD